MTEKESKSKRHGIKALVKEDEDLLRSLMKTALQGVLEAEMSEALGAGKGERSGQRVGYRSGYYGHKLVSNGATANSACRWRNSKASKSAGKLPKPSRTGITGAHTVTAFSQGGLEI